MDDFGGNYEEIEDRVSTKYGTFGSDDIPAILSVNSWYRSLGDTSSRGTHSAVIGTGTDAELFVCGYRRSLTRTLLFAVFSLLLGFTPVLLTRWRPVWRLRLTHSTSSLSDATRLLVKDSHGQSHVVSVMTAPVTYSVPSSYVIDSGSSHTSDSQSVTSSSSVTDISQPLLSDRSIPQLRYFWFFHLKYTWNEDSGCFEQLSGLDLGCTVQQLLESYTGYSELQQAARLSLFGENRMTIDVKSYGRLLIDEALNPFYIFQLWSIVLWAFDEYYIYAGCILLISLVSISITLYETRRQSEVLQEMVASSAVKTATVRRSPECEEVVDSECLVPGDVLVLPSTGCMMPCDAALITGSCIVNEAMLTGESVPVTKTSLVISEDGEVYSPDRHSRSTLFCGTHVIQTRFYGDSPVLAIVVRTGFCTAKGELVRSILFPKPLGFKFYRDSIKFLCVLAVLAAFGVAYTLYLYIIRGASVRDQILRCLDIITVVVPPALPAAMTVGTVYAQNRLKHALIYCISPPRINIAGKVKLFCFDKTGTLTEDGLSTWGVVDCCYTTVNPHQDSGGGGGGSSTSPPPTPPQSPPPATRLSTSARRCVAELSDRSSLKMALASCHGLTRLDNQLIGDPLDIEMFRATGWELEEPVVSDSTKYDLLAPTVVRAPSAGDSGATGTSTVPDECGSRLDPASCAELADSGVQVGIVRQFPFSSDLQRMSVITRTLGENHMDLYCKGAPEKIETLCKEVPENFHSVLHEYVVQGYRVLAVAHKQFGRKLQWHHAQRLKRDQVECDMLLRGLLIMQNRLKPQTQPVIKTLQQADIRCVMVTGDNLLTAVSVGRECGLIEPGACAINVDAVAPSGDQPAQLIFSRAAADLSDNSSATCTGIDGQVAVNISGQRATSEDYHLVTTGRSWRVIRQHFPDMVDRLVVKGTIFARMAPEQKAQLVESLQSLGYTAGMCGDGANDCEALRAAHVGVSLSEAEASVAAPFTCATADITCVPRLIAEGRCALTTSFATFKYMALYSMIQFVSVLLLYSHYSNLSDVQFLHVDLVITTSVAVTMGYTRAAVGLHPRRPTGSLLAAANLLSVFLQVFIMGVCQLLALWLLKIQPWYRPVPPTRGEGRLLCWENTVIFFVSSFQYLILAAAFSRGPPYRRPFYTNPLFLSTLLSLTALQTLLVLVPYRPLASFFGVVSADNAHTSSFMRHFVIYLTVAHCCTAFAIEYALSDSRGLKSVLRRFGYKRRPKNAYKLVLDRIGSDRNWPPLQRPLMANTETTHRRRRHSST